MKCCGYVFRDSKDLSIQLGMGCEYIKHLTTLHPEWTYEDCINYYNTNPRGLVRGTKEVCGIEYSSYSELSVKLGKCKQYVSNMRSMYPSLTVEDIVRFVLEKQKKKNLIEVKHI